jgi:hypothetical protein
MKKGDDVRVEPRRRGAHRWRGRGTSLWAEEAAGNLEAKLSSARRPRATRRRPMSISRMPCRREKKKKKKRQRAR